MVAAPRSRRDGRWRLPRRAPHLAIVGAAFLFGTTFVVVKSAVEHAEPVPFLGARFCLGALLLAAWRRWPGRRRPTPAPLRGAGVRVGLAAGTALLAGYLFQTVGLQYTSGSVSAFITYLLVVIVPVIHAVLTRHLPPVGVALGIVVATLGLFLLSGSGGGLLGRGELLTLGCAVAFAVHVIVLSGPAVGHDPLALAAVQLAVVGGACLLPGLWLGGYRFPASTWAAVVYTAAAASALAFFLQTWGQARLHPTRAALFLMLEPVFAAGLGYVVGDRLGARGVAGGLLILAGIAVAEWATLATRAGASCPAGAPT